MGCDNCFQSQKGMEEALVNIRAQAKTFAIQEKTVVAIYREGYELSFIKAELSAGLNVVDRVTPY
jgi:NMD protein affecting ribosome stability and mRNA decay